MVVPVGKMPSPRSTSSTPTSSARSHSSNSTASSAYSSASLSSNCKFVEDIREKIAKAKKLYAEYQKEKRERENPPPPEWIEMKTFWVRIRKPMSERKVSAPIDIPRIVYEEDW